MASRMVDILRKLALSLKTTSGGEPIYIYVMRAYEAPPSNPASIVADNLHYEGRQVDFSVRALQSLQVLSSSLLSSCL